MKTYQKIISGLIIGFFSLIIVFCGVFYFNNKDVFTERMQSSYREESVSIVNDPVTFLVMGADNTSDQSREETSGYRTDVLIYGAVDVQTNRLTMTSIPRDTLAYIPCVDDYGKINAAMQYGYNDNQNIDEGIQCTIDTVEYMFQKPVDYYVFVTFDTFIAFVDAIGGIDLTATQTFCEQDSNSNPDAYCFEEGETYHMDGEMALAYSRNRHADSDYYRGLRQQEVIQAIIEQTLKPETLANLPSIITQTLDSGVKTNLSMNEMYAVGMHYANLVSKGVTIGMDVENLRIYGEEVSYGGSTHLAPYQESIDYCIQQIDLILNRQYEEDSNTNSFTWPSTQDTNDGEFYEGTIMDGLAGLDFSVNTSTYTSVPETDTTATLETETTEPPVTEEAPPPTEETTEPPADTPEDPSTETPTP